MKTGVVEGSYRGYRAQTLSLRLFYTGKKIKAKVNGKMITPLIEGEWITIVLPASGKDKASAFSVEMLEKNKYKKTDKRRSVEAK